MAKKTPDGGGIGSSADPISQPAENSLSEARGEDSSAIINAQGLSRRDFVKRAGILGAAASLPISMLNNASAQGNLSSLRGSLSSAERSTLNAIVARLIPSDENGPGALEAGAANYIDRSLQGPLASLRGQYAAGLAAINKYSQESKGAAFAQLSTEKQDAVLSEMEKNSAQGFPNSSAFFNLLRTHTMEGTFCDPFYGGNANFAGWDLIGYPGVRVIVTADEQRMDAKPNPTHQSAYDYTMFSAKDLSTKRGSKKGA